MIERTLVRFKTKDLFNKRLGLKEIPETSICFIEDTKEIWTHGQFYAIPNEEVFISNGEEPTGNEEIWVDLSEDSPTVPTIEEAPKDGKQYARKDESWDEVSSNGDYFIIIEDFVPSDGYMTELTFLKNGESSSYEELKNYLDKVYNDRTKIPNITIELYNSVERSLVIEFRKNFNKDDSNNSGYIYEFIAFSENELYLLSLNYDPGLIHEYTFDKKKLKDYISKDNTEEYTPTGDYNPATKKYVDNSISTLSTVATTGSYNDLSDKPNDKLESVVLDIVQIISDNGNITQDKYDKIINLLPPSGYSEFEFKTENPGVIAKVIVSNSLSMVDESDESVPGIRIYQIAYSRFHINYHIKILIKEDLTYSQSGSSCSMYGQDGDIDLGIADVITGSITADLRLKTSGDGTKSLMDDGKYKRILSTDNTTEYIPTSEYSPATKKYVDDRAINVIKDIYNLTKFISDSSTDLVEEGSQWDRGPVEVTDIINNIFGSVDSFLDNRLNYTFYNATAPVVGNNLIIGNDRTGFYHFSNAYGGNNNISYFQWTIKINEDKTVLGFRRIINLLSDTNEPTKGLMNDGKYHKVWTPDNDGSESGLDADTLDGYHISNIQLGGWNNFVTYEYTEGKVSYNWIKLLDLSQIESDGYVEVEIDIPGDNNYPTLEKLFIKVSRFNDNNTYNSISLKINGLLDNEIKVLSKIDGNRTVWICIKAAWNGNKSRIRLVGQESMNIDLSSLTTQTNEPEGGSDIVYGKCGIRLDLNTNTFRYYYDPDLNEENLAYWYEIDENNPSTICATGGNRSVIESLRSKFKRCIAMPYGDDAAMISYCKENYSAEWPDGTTIEIKSNHQNRMVHFPKYYHKTVEKSPSIWRTYISEQQLDNDYIEEPESLLASFEGAINSEGMLISTAHQTSASSKTINEFVTAARTHGPLWGIGDYRTHATIARMFCAYYKNTDISTSNSNIPCSGGTKRYNYGLTGSTIHLGNLDGRRETLEDTGYYSTNFLGLEDCYYSKWEFVQGINILKGKYVVYDGGSFPDKDVDELEAAGAINIRIVGYEPNPSATEAYSGFIKKISQGKYGDMLPIGIGGTETTYYSDYSWFNPTGNRILLRSGLSVYESRCGVFTADINASSGSRSDEGVSARLAFYGKIVVVDSDTFKKNQV